MSSWSKWAPFPDPRRLGVLAAPLGPGVYELRLTGRGELVLIGIGKNCASRFASLLPAPIGQGTRRNTGKRKFVLDHIAKIEYRTMACNDQESARSVEKKRLAEQTYLFPT